MRAGQSVWHQNRWPNRSKNGGLGRDVESE
ncbi:hypothetical protein GDI0725 [Gluconacetobacter diazotrophicus PA1 5]|uniref:Uncharacterized protein n=1 Tax=Gluconacetobacter diazotrophicus (strain ATCC 49037 / DSM 5601 / CCUG 37298 / CIP 103539 / LMG 7603 / PAl5) TaxID=272568 RepID=A9HAB3_GLUDA|nr:hypothetical protein GDI0725 [Gluconacetobacter diazotrophicus PA1 5]